MADPAVDDSGRRERIVVAVDHDRNRELLADWLGSVPNYEVVPVDGGGLPERYDLCLVDRPAFTRLREALGRREDDAFRPCLLTTSDRDRSADIGDLDPEDADLVDDVVSVPVEQAVLRRRIENLLRARRVSLRLAEREEQYRQLVRLTPEAILIVRDDQILYANRAATELFDRSEEALVGRSVLEHVPESARSDMESLLASIADGRRTDEFVDLPVRTADDEVRETTVAGVAVTFEGDPAVQLVVRDVTERRRRRQQLDLFGRAIDAAVQGITIADARQDDEPIVYANEAFERVTGYPIAEVLGRNCRFLQGENTDASTVAEIRAAVDERRPVSVELLNYRKDGTPFWNRLDIVPVRDESGTVTHFLGLQQDVTDRVRREQRLTVLDRVLRHNLRNRAAVIGGYADRLATATDEDGDLAEAADHADRIREATDRLLQISEQVRSYRSVITDAEADLDRRSLVEVLEPIVAGLREHNPGATVDVAVERDVAVRVHDTVPLALEDLFALAAGSDPRLHLSVTVDADDRVGRLRIVDHDGSLPRDALESVPVGEETQVEHPEGLELWLLRWAVECSNGELAVDHGDPPALTVRLRRADPVVDPD